MNESMQGAAETAIALLSGWGISVIGAIALLIVGRIAASWVRGSTT